MYKVALDFRNYICDTGEQLPFVFNRKDHKTPLQARKQVILGCLFDSVTRRIRSSEKKVLKNVSRIHEALLRDVVQVSKIMLLRGNLAFAANIALLTDLSSQKFRLTTLVKLGLRV